MINLRFWKWFKNSETTPITYSPWLYSSEESPHKGLALIYNDSVVSCWGAIASLVPKDGRWGVLDKQYRFIIYDKKVKGSVPFCVYEQGVYGLTLDGYYQYCWKKTGELFKESGLNIGQEYYIKMEYKDAS